MKGQRDHQRSQLTVFRVLHRRDRGRLLHPQRGHLQRQQNRPVPRQLRVHGPVRVTGPALVRPRRNEQPQDPLHPRGLLIWSLLCI